MVRFKCLLSGNVFQFEHEWDVEEMRQHPQYEEIEDGLQEKKQNSKKEVKKVNKKTVKVEE